MPTQKSSSKGSCKCGKGKSGRTLVKTPTEYVYEYTLNSREDYNHETVYSLLPSADEAKPIANYEAFARADELKLKSTKKCCNKVHQDRYKYKDIDHYYSFSNYPRLLVLGSRHPTTRKKRYEIYRMPPRKIEEIVDLINTVHNVDEDPNFAPVQTGVTQVDTGVVEQPLQDHMDLAVAVGPADIQTQPEICSPIVLHQQQQQQSRPCYEYYPVVESCVEEKEPYVEENGPYVVGDQPCVEVAKPIYADNVDQGWQRPEPVAGDDHPGKQHTLERFSQHIDKSSVLAYDMTYISTDPVKGNRIDDDGSIFMYVAHYPHRSSCPTGDHDKPVEDRFKEAYIHG